MRVCILLYALSLLVLFSSGCSERRPAGPPEKNDPIPAVEPDLADER